MIARKAMMTRATLIAPRFCSRSELDSADNPKCRLRDPSGALKRTMICIPALISDLHSRRNQATMDHFSCHSTSFESASRCGPGSHPCPQSIPITTSRVLRLSLRGNDHGGGRELPRSPRGQKPCAKHPRYNISTLAHLSLSIPISSSIL
jgi:hypothetical protein